MVVRTNVVTDSTDVGIPSSVSVVDAATGTERGVTGSWVRFVLHASGGEIFGDSGLLISRLRINVGESTAGGEASDRSLLIHRGATRQERRADCRQVRARGREVRAEDLARLCSGTKTAIWIIVAGRASNTGVAGRDYDGHALHA